MFTEQGSSLRARGEDESPRGFHGHLAGRALEFTPGKATEAAARLPDAEVLLVVGGLDDEIAAARTLLERGWRAAAFVAAGVEPA